VAELLKYISNWIENNIVSLNKGGNNGQK
jgi:hypothetical protein